MKLDQRVFGAYADESVDFMHVVLGPEGTKDPVARVVIFYLPLLASEDIIEEALDSAALVIANAVAKSFNEGTKQ